MLNLVCWSDSSPTSFPSESAHTKISISRLDGSLRNEPERFPRAPSAGPLRRSDLAADRVWTRRRLMVLFSTFNWSPSDLAFSCDSLSSSRCRMGAVTVTPPIGNKRCYNRRKSGQFTPCKPDYTATENREQPKPQISEISFVSRHQWHCCRRLVAAGRYGHPQMRLPFQHCRPSFRIRSRRCCWPIPLG